MHAYARAPDAGRGRTDEKNSQRRGGEKMDVCRAIEREEEVGQIRKEVSRAGFGSTRLTAC